MNTSGAPASVFVSGARQLQIPQCHTLIAAETQVRYVPGPLVQLLRNSVAIIEVQDLVRRSGVGQGLHHIGGRTSDDYLCSTVSTDLFTIRLLIRNHFDVHLAIDVGVYIETDFQA